MKRVDFKKQSSVFYIGKGMIIGVIILTASLSFFLGFLVGNRTQPFPEQHLTGMTPGKAPELTSQENQPGGAPKQTETHIPAQKPAIAQDQHPADSQNPIPNPDVTVSDKRADQPVSADIPMKKEPVKIARDAPERKDTKHDQDVVPTPKDRLGRKYTVQVGAFRNPEEADLLKDKLTKKGYQVFIISAKTKQKDTLHKVMVGEYKTRKEAEVQSIKLKNAEGLRTFVTFVAQEGAIRQQ